MLKILAFFIICITTAFTASAEKTDSLVPDSTIIKSQAASNEKVENNKQGEWILYQPSAPDSIQQISLPILTVSLSQKPVVDKLKRRKKIIATLLAFPLPFGIIGLHRVYLGTKPYVPLVYIVTLGGAAGIVPFIDFLVLLLEKDIRKYENNNNIIMWAN